MDFDSFYTILFFIRLVIEMNDSVEYWLDLADYDIETAKAMLNTGRYLYVGFMCHQVIEKALKAIIASDCQEGEIPPKIHNLIKLVNKAALYEKMSTEQLEFIDMMNPLNVEARYPDYKNRIATNLSEDSCKQIIRGTEEMLCWIKKQL